MAVIKTFRNQNKKLAEMIRVPVVQERSIKSVAEDKKAFHFVESFLNKL